MRVKICGITTVEDALAAAGAKADYIGLVFDPSSKRYVQEGLAAKIIRSLKAFPAKIVGVFAEKNLHSIAQKAKTLKLDAVQILAPSLRLDLDLLKDFEKLLVLPVQRDGSYTHASFLLEENEAWLYDCCTFEEGKPFNWDQFKRKESGPFFIAGGLSISNLEMAALKLSPLGLDVSSGVCKSCGVKKDAQLMAEFVKKAHHVQKP